MFCLTVPNIETNVNKLFMTIEILSGESSGDKKKENHGTITKMPDGM